MPREIVSTEDVCGGEPRIAQTRLTCANVVLLLTKGEMPLAEFLAVYPHLDRETVQACINYCARRQCVADRVLNFCAACSLHRRPRDEDEDEPLDIWQLAHGLTV